VGNTVVFDEDHDKKQYVKFRV